MNKDTLKETVDGLKRLASPSAEIFTDGERLTSFISLAQKLPDLDEIIQQAKEDATDEVVSEIREGINKLTWNIMEKEAEEMSDIYIGKMATIREIEEIINQLSNTKKYE